MMALPLTNCNINFDNLFLEFRRRFYSLLNFDFRDLEIQSILEILNVKDNNKNDTTYKSTDIIFLMFSELDLSRLRNYIDGKIEYYIIKDLIP